MFRPLARAFAQEVLKPLVPVMEQQERLSSELVAQLFDQGFMAVDAPLDRGGAGGTFTDTLDVVHEFAQVDPATSLLVDIHNTLVQPIMAKHASPELQNEFWPRLCTQDVGCFALSEAGSGSDAFALKTTATPTEHGYELNGAKLWISNSDLGQQFLIFAREEAADTPSYRDIQCFLVPRDAPGLEVGTPETKLGLKASATCELVLDNCYVPKHHKLTYPGYKIAIESLNAGRIGIAAQMLGIAHGALAITYPYLHDRQQFGKPLYEFQAVNHAFGQLRAQEQAVEALVYRAAAKYEADEPYLVDACSAKLLASTLAQHTTSKCIDLVGGVGFTEPFGLAKLFRDCKIGTIYEGTDHIQLDTLAKQPFEG